VTLTACSSHSLNREGYITSTHQGPIHISPFPPKAPPPLMKFLDFLKRLLKRPSSTLLTDPNNKMAYTVIALYTADTKFDIEYYKTKHMPLCTEEWGPVGFKGRSSCSIHLSSHQHPSPLTLCAPTSIFPTGIPTYPPPAPLPHFTT
jgi:hypothetical protein